jgi:hypothetical protein
VDPLRVVGVTTAGTDASVMGDPDRALSDLTSYAAGDPGSLRAKVVLIFDKERQRDIKTELLIRTTLVAGSTWTLSVGTRAGSLLVTDAGTCLLPGASLLWGKRGQRTPSCACAGQAQALLDGEMQAGTFQIVGGATVKLQFARFQASVIFSEDASSRFQPTVLVEALASARRACHGTPVLQNSAAWTPPGVLRSRGHGKKVVIPGKPGDLAQGRSSTGFIDCLTATLSAVGCSSRYPVTRPTRCLPMWKSVGRFLRGPVVTEARVEHLGGGYGTGCASIAYSLWCMHHRGCRCRCMVLEAKAGSHCHGMRRQHTLTKGLPRSLWGCRGLYERGAEGFPRRNAAGDRGRRGRAPKCSP